MPTKEKRIGRIEVRFVLDFFKSPAVCTMLATMPPQERSKLILSLLEKHIEQIEHPAANAEVQLKLIERVLSNGKLQESARENSPKAVPISSTSAGADLDSQGDLRSSGFRPNRSNESSAVIPNGSGLAQVDGKVSGNQDESATLSTQDTMTSPTLPPLSRMATRWIDEL